LTAFLALGVSMLAPAARADSETEAVIARAQAIRGLATRGAEMLRLRGRDVAIGSEVASFRPGSIPRVLVPPEDDRPMANRALADWTPYAGPFDRAAATHLLRRAVPGAQWGEISSAMSWGLDLTVAKLLVPRAAPLPPGAWVSEPFPDISGYTDEMIQELIELYVLRQEYLRAWWGDRFLEVPSQPSARESMTHFWHDHFATQGSEVILPQAMYVQNALFRRFAAGNFRELVRGVYKDPAMLLYLNNQDNYVGHINENFARELLELFTMGLDEYTQEDIVEAARAFTGWVTLDGLTGIFVPALHDDGMKTFLGQTGAWHGDDIVRIIFEQEATARFITTKLYTWFVDEYPDPVLIDELAATLRASDYEVAPVLSKIFRSAHFYDPELRGSLITDGIDRSFGVMRACGLHEVHLLEGYGSLSWAWTWWSQFYFSHMLLEPPNVAGWPGYRAWVNSTTLPWRKTLDTALVDGQIFGADLGMKVDVMTLANEFTNPNDALLLVDEMAAYFFGMPPTPLVRQRLVDELLQGSEPYDWSMFDPEARSRIEGLLRLIMRLPDFQTK